MDNKRINGKRHTLLGGQPLIKKYYTCLIPNEKIKVEIIIKLNICCKFRTRSGVRSLSLPKNFKEDGVTTTSQLSKMSNFQRFELSLNFKWNVTTLLWQGTFCVFFAAFYCSRLGLNLPACKPEAVGRGIAIRASLVQVGNKEMMQRKLKKSQSKSVVLFFVDLSVTVHDP